MRRFLTDTVITVLLAACLGATLAACTTESSISVAPEVELELVATSEPAIQAIEVLPAVDGAQLPTLDPSKSESSDDDESFGSIIGPKYTQPPTNTPPPTPAPTETPIFIPPTQSGSVYTTPVSVDQTRLDGEQMGIQLHYNFDVDGWSRTLHQVAPLRVGWIKIQASWEWLQPSGAGQFDKNFRLFQLHVQEADKRGFKVMLSIAKAPDWTRNADRNEDGPPDDLNHLIGFIQLLLEKLGPYVDAIEVWNEPNFLREWTGSRPLGGASYMELFRVSYDAIRAYSPKITVVTAGLAPTGNLDGVTVDDRAFLRQMYQAGLARYSDVKIGIHPYGWGNPPDFLCCNNVDGQGWDDQPQFFFLQTIRDYSRIIAAFGDSAQMWVTEFGWATWEKYPTESPEIWMSYNSAVDQMDYALRAFEIGQSRPDIGPMILWNLSFAEEMTVNQRSEMAAYSILYPRFDGSDRKRKRPLYRALESRP